MNIAILVDMVDSIFPDEHVIPFPYANIHQQDILSFPFHYEDVLSKGKYIMLVDLCLSDGPPRRMISNKTNFYLLACNNLIRPSP